MIPIVLSQQPEQSNYLAEGQILNFKTFFVIMAFCLNVPLVEEVI